jgi:membrane protein YqaA with SNARE-associated domain
LVDIRRVSICFITILLDCYSLYQPVNADVHIPFHSYHPNVLYLGRHNYLEDIGLPSKPEDKASKYIYAIVQDIYGKTLHGNLTYVLDNKKPSTIPMSLWSGIPANGTWEGEIPNQKADMPYTVSYTVSFKDDLGYSVNATGKKFLVTDRYILADSRQNLLDSRQNNTTSTKCVWNEIRNAYTPVDSLHSTVLRKLAECLTVNFNAIVSDYDGNPRVILYMYPYHEIKAYMKEMTEGNQTLRDRTFTASVFMPVNTRLRFYATLYDSHGHINSVERIMTFSAPTSPINTISVTTHVSNVDITNQSANMEIKLNGPLINFTHFTMPYRQRNWNAENLNLHVVNVVNNNTTPASYKRDDLQLINLATPLRTQKEENEYVFGSFHNQTGNISSIGFGSFDATIGKDNSSSTRLKPYFPLLSGNPLAFPLDHYSVDLFIRIPFTHITINNKGGTYGDWYKATWIATDPEITLCTNSTSHSNFVKCDPPTGNDPSMNTDTFLKIYTEFNRNDFAFWTITFPILFIFFLLGIICFLEPTEHYLVGRIAITLGVFAFVFTFDTILPGVKPHYILNISTFADFLLKLVLVAAIAFTISSLIGYRIAIVADKKSDKESKKDSKNSNTKFKKLINIVYTYHVYDVLAIAFVLVMVFEECIISNRYSLNYLELVIYPIIIILGLGWGLLSQLIYECRDDLSKVFLKIVKPIYPTLRPRTSMQRKQELAGVQEEAKSPNGKELHIQVSETDVHETVKKLEGKGDKPTQG